jgi:hypothetical protein
MPTENTLALITRFQLIGPVRLVAAMFSAAINILLCHSGMLVHIAWSI